MLCDELRWTPLSSTCVFRQQLDLYLDDFGSAVRLGPLVCVELSITHIGARVGTSAAAGCESVLTHHCNGRVYKCLLHFLFQVLRLFCKRRILQ